MENTIDRHVFYTSDDTVITAEVLGRAVISQLPVTVSSITLPFIENESRARTVKDQIDAIYHQTGVHPLVSYSIVLSEIRAIILQSEGLYQDIVQVLVAPLQREVKLDPTPIAHRTHGLNPNNLDKYDMRIATVDYTLAHDDGISLHNLDQAQVILLGVSRCGKTPASPYLAIQFGIHAANYPFIVDDMDNLVLPAPLRPFQHKLFGLTINPERLAAIREERRENGCYASLRQCRMEVTEVEALYRKNQIPWANSTNYSVEETAIRVLDIMSLSRRMYQRTSVLACSFVIMLTTRRGVAHFALEVNCDWFIVVRITSRQSCRRSSKLLKLIVNRTDELRTARIEGLITPTELTLWYPVTPGVATHTTNSRRRTEKILNGKDRRLSVIIGPYSVHDLTTTMEYTTRLQSLRNQCQSRLEIVMRTYYRKPRVVIGWKGLISDPDLNGSHRVDHGLELVRKLLLQVDELGIPTATEFLGMMAGQFIADLISWGAVGTCTIESQIHREMASALSCPVGFKNGTDSDTRIAADVIRATRASHMFLSPDKSGRVTIYQTSSSLYGHITVRGNEKPNYHADDITTICDILHEFDLPGHLVIDFNHGDCQKQHRHQLEVYEGICQQARNGSGAIAGIMAEGSLCGGMQKVVGGQPLTYSQPITDPCLDWKNTEYLVEKLASTADTRFWIRTHS